jgi:hypothetical protein
VFDFIRIMKSRLAWRVLAAIAGATIVVGGMLFVATQNPEVSSFYPPCLFHKATSLHCPGCGTGRAAHAMLNGNWERAMQMNPLLITSIPALLAMVFFPQVNRWKPLPILVGGLLVAYWILRNLPGFEWLAPGP